MNALTMLEHAPSLGRAALAFARVVRDPDRLDDVFQFIDQGVGKNPALVTPVIEAFNATPEGARSVRERTRIGRLDLDALAREPASSLGASFAAHLREHRLDPAALPVRAANSDGEYVIAHLYETHDVWHVLTGFGTDRAGELGLQAFYLAQAPSRVAQGLLAIGGLNTLIFEFDDYVRRMDAIVHGWTLGRRARCLLGIDWASRWHVPLAEVRRELGIDLPS
jgi:ubiquinone biosynthesis protein Coq4